jgi:hypothetical protein
MNLRSLSQCQPRRSSSYYHLLLTERLDLHLSLEYTLPDWLPRLGDAGPRPRLMRVVGVGQKGERSASPWPPM